MDLSRKAKEATQKAESQVVKSYKKEEKSKQKVSVFRGENYDLRTKRMTKQWEETLVRKHELWEVYKSIKKNLNTAVQNVKIVKNELKLASNNVVKLMKISALNPKDIGISKRIDESKHRHKEIEE